MTEASGRPAWTLRRRLGRAFGVVALVLALLFAAVVTTGVLFAKNGNAVAYRWQPALSWSRSAFSDIQDQETGIRGYALSGDERFLAPYRSGVTNERAARERARDLVGDDADLRPRFERWAAAADAWNARIARPALAAVEAGDRDGIRLAASAEGKQLFDVMRSRFDDLVTRLIARVQDVRAARAAYGIAFAVGGGLLLLVLLASGLALWRGLGRWVLRPVESLASQSRVVAGGELHRGIAADGPHEIVSLAEDVEAMRLRIASELDRAERIGDELRVRGAELARSNEDLQQFAYVASHDLSEPLRKVANFCQLLERQYAEQLDDRARQYIDFAVDGAKRMQALITDLLALSRVGRNAEPTESIDLDRKLDLALHNLGDRMDEAGATVVRETPLPVVRGDRSLLVSLLENLVGNAVKYRRDDVSPVVRISAEATPADARPEWTFTVRDNGIGIDPQYADRIFAVFQRLHLRDRYGGTGIGLALCRRIVEYHGGRIWLVTDDPATGALESDSSETGATFRFTLPGAVTDAEPRDRRTA